MVRNGRDGGKDGCRGVPCNNNRRHPPFKTQVNDAIHALHGGDCLRAVVIYAKP